MLSKFKVGHYSDTENGTGLTVIIADGGATAGVSVRGSSPATRETDLLKNGKTVQKIDAVVLSGGSAYGLEGACGVMEYLHEKGIGYDAGEYKVPIVVGASLYDLEYKNFAYPNKTNGYEACENASSKFVGGNVGAGCGATVSKACGMDCAVKAGLGIQTYTLNGVEITVIVAVNALGDIVHNGKIVAGALNEDGSFVDCKKVFSLGSTRFPTANTTIGCIITNADITKEQANNLADIAHDGLAISVSPSHTRFDGDAFFVMSSNEVPCPIDLLSSVIPELTRDAILASVTDVTPIKKKVNGALLWAMRKFLK